MSDPQITQLQTVLSGLLSMLDRGKIIPGERLPSERRLSELLGVSRANIRLALQKLEYYGLVRTYPQSGSVLSDYSSSVIRNQIKDMMDIDSFDFHSLVTVRILLEAEAVRLCCANRTDDDMEMLELSLRAFEDNMYSEKRDEKDFAFHMTMAKASHNPVIASLLLTITPEVLRFYRSYKACSMPPEEIYQEHRDMLDCILQRDADAAEACIRKHFRSIEEFSESVSYDLPRNRI